MHSGWGALVAVSNRAEALEVIDRRRVTVTTRGTPGANQPYHFAENLEVQEAEKFLADCFAISKRLALTAVGEAVNDLGGRQYRVVGCALLLGSGRALLPLPKILSSHALIHAAEGEFFWAVLSKTCEELELPVTGIPEHSLNEYIQRAFGESTVAPGFDAWPFCRAALDQGSENRGARRHPGSRKAARQDGDTKVSNFELRVKGKTGLAGGNPRCHGIKFRNSSNIFPDADNLSAECYPRHLNSSSEVCPCRIDPKCRIGISSSTFSTRLALPLFRSSAHPTRQAFFGRGFASARRSELHRGNRKTSGGSHSM